MMSNETKSDIEKELYYLIFKFLENGPCNDAAEVLRKEIEKNQLVLPRKDWLGRDCTQKLGSFDIQNSHTSPDYLLRLSQRLNPVVERCFPASVHSLKSLLCRGSLSLLRDVETSTAHNSINRTCSRYAACIHNAPKIVSCKSRSSSLVPVLYGQSLSGTNKHGNLISQCDVFSKLCMHKQILGHLASVYCVLFDDTGSIIVTGADDNLLKVWSSYNGLLIATFRGHSGQISDITINKENNLLASGSNDKTVRVWSLTNTQPIAVLQGHTGIITSLKFCPSANENSRYLMSTGGDGHVCFWFWDFKKIEFNLTPIRFNEKSRPGAQMLCSSFSPGGTFVATGSSDNYIRVYQLYPNGPEKIAELPNHADHVDSILYSNFGDRFLSGSRDGSAMIWYYKNSEWQAKCLDASSNIEGSANANEDNKNKLKVTMICWNLTDKYAITAGTDYLLRVWDSYSTKLVHSLKGHTDEVYILESHPTQPDILLSAGHDGHIILWNITQCKKIKIFFNMLQGQGHGAIFDCKFSPTGLQFAATDSHGHLLIFGMGNDEPYKIVPYEQFFHTDYRPIIRDTNNYVLDEQTQTAPHLMPPPFLVDIDGNPYPSEYQLLIPGRNSSNQPQLRAEDPIIQEDLPPLLAEITAAEAAERNLQSPTRSRQPSVAEASAALLSPGGVGVGLRESGDVEGVRQQNNLYVSGDITDADADIWRNRVIIQKNNLYNAEEDEKTRQKISAEELKIYLREKLKIKPTESDDLDNTKHYLRSATSGRGRGRGRTRSRVQQHVTYIRGSALQNHNISQPVSSGREIVNIDGDGESSESEPEDWQGESSDSSNDSDWTHEPKKIKDTEKTTRGRRKKRRLSSDAEMNNADSDVDVEQRSSSSESTEEENGHVNGHEEHDSSDNDDSNSDNEPTTRKSSRRTFKGKQKAESKAPVLKKTLQKKVKVEIKSKKPIPSVQNVEEYLKFYQPPDWLLGVEMRKFPYVPQINDEVYYLRQGHMLYVQEVIKQNEYDIQEGKQAYKRYDIAPSELCKLVGISYDVGPPKMCSLKLELIGKKKSTGGTRTITVRFHDMPHVIDFFILKHIYENSLQQNWDSGQRFRCIIDDEWYYGTIVEVSPFDENFPISPFLSLVVKWDSGDDERLSPWDLEQIPLDEDGEFGQDKTPVVEEDKELFKYPTTEEDWPSESQEDFIERTCKGLEDFSAIEIASPFAFPVDVQTYPTYWSCIAFPTDLETIRRRLKNQFYRRMEALLWEIRQLKTNAVKFNKAGSSIVADAIFVVKILSKFIREPAIKDTIGLYNEMRQNEETKSRRPVYDDQSEVEDFDEDEEEELEEDLVIADEPGGSGTSSGTGSSTQHWTVEARSLLEFINSKDDAQPFREPVDINTFEDYNDIIREPIDISTIRHRLESNQYDNAEGFIRDFQLIFKNSKAYNTDRRSIIFKMTLRLSALFEARCKDIRHAFAHSSSDNTHWTRRRTRNQAHDDTRALNNVTPSSHQNENRNCNSNRQTRNSHNRVGSPSKTKITLEQFIQRPSTRSRHVEVDVVDVMKSKYRPMRNGTHKRNPSTNHETSDSESCSESDVEKKVTTPEYEAETTERSRSGRVIKRRRYGFESEDEIENTAKRKKSTEKKPSKKPINNKTRKTSKRGASSASRSSRRKSTVNYCEDDLDEFEGFEEEEEVEEEIDDNSESESSSNSSSDDEQAIPAGISSRGRIRKVASRYSDFVDK